MTRQRTARIFTGTLLLAMTAWFTVRRMRRRDRGSPGEEGPTRGASTARVTSTAKGLDRATLGEPNLYLTWKANYGSRRATDHLSVSCSDTGRVDTLFLGFETGRYTMGVQTLSAVLYFHPQPGESLGTFWHFKRGWENQGNLLIDFDQAAGVPGELPWQVMGYGSVSYDHRSGRGRLDLSYTVPPSDVKGTTPENRYTFARVRIRQRRADLAGCVQPVCIELADLRLKLATGRTIVIDRGLHRVVSWNTAPGAGCAPGQVARRACLEARLVISARRALDAPHRRDAGAGGRSRGAGPRSAISRLGRLPERFGFRLEPRVHLRCQRGHHLSPRRNVLRCPRPRRTWSRSTASSISSFRPIAAIPPFWHFESGGCNNSGLVISDARPHAGCSGNSNTMCGPAGGACDGLITAYGPGVGGSDRGRLLVALVRRSDSPVNLARGARPAFRVRVGVLDGSVGLDAIARGARRRCRFVGRRPPRTESTRRGEKSRRGGTHSLRRPGWQPSRHDQRRPAGGL